MKIANNIKNNRFIFPTFSVLIIFSLLAIVSAILIPFLNFELNSLTDRENIFITYSWDGSSAEVVENNVTSILEGGFASVGHIKNISSRSFNGGGEINIEIDNNEFYNQVKYELSTLVRRLHPQLPERVSYPMISGSISSKYRSVLSYTMYADKNIEALSEIATKHIKRSLLKIDCVQDVRISGNPEYYWMLTYDKSILKVYNITLSELRNCINAHFAILDGGRVLVSNTSASKDELLYIKMKIETSEEPSWNSIVVKKYGDRNIYLTDIVKVTHKERQGSSFTRINGYNSLNIEISFQAGFDFAKNASRIKRAMQLISSNTQSFGFILKYDSTSLLSAELELILRQILIAVFVTALGIFLVSRSIRYSLVIYITLFINILLVTTVYYFLNLPLNAQSLRGGVISFGILLINSIIVSECFYRNRRLKVFIPFCASIVCLLGVLFGLKLLLVIYHHEFIFALVFLIITLSASLITNVFLTPALISSLLADYHLFCMMKKPMQKRFKAVLFFLITTLHRFRKGILVLTIILLGIPTFLLPKKMDMDSSLGHIYNRTIGSEFFYEKVKPHLDDIFGGSIKFFFTNELENSELVKEKDSPIGLYISVRLPRGSDIAQMNKIVTDFEVLLSRYKEVKIFKSLVNSGSYARIEVTFFDNIGSGIFPFKLKGLLERQAALIGLADFRIDGVGKGFNNSLTNQRANHAFVISGYNYKSLKSYIDEVKALMKRNIRIKNVSSGSKRERDVTNLESEVVYEINKTHKLAEINSTFGYFSNSLNWLTSSDAHLTNILLNEKYEAVVASSTEAHFSSWDLLNTPLNIDSNRFVRLKDVGFLDKGQTNNEIIRNNQQYEIVVNYNFVGDSFLAGIARDTILKQMKASLPLGYLIKPVYLDSSFDQQDLAWVFSIIIFIIFLLSSILLDNGWQAFSVLFVIVIAFLGIVLVKYLFLTEFGLGGYTGLVLVFAYSVSSSFFIISGYNDLLKFHKTRQMAYLCVLAVYDKMFLLLKSYIVLSIFLLCCWLGAPKDIYWEIVAKTTIIGVFFSLFASTLLLPIILLWSTKMMDLKVNKTK